MKYLTLILLVILTFGCAPQNDNPYQVESSTTETSEEVWKDKGDIETDVYETRMSYVEVFKIEGHKYLGYWKGGIVHAESCNGVHQ